MDIVVTWPKSRTLQSYLDECRKAERAKRQINFRVAQLPTNVDTGDKCYVVYASFVRGWHVIVDLAYRAENEVLDPLTGRWWPAGRYVVRDPVWHEIERVRPMGGFQGWRYYR